MMVGKMDMITRGFSHESQKENAMVSLTESALDMTDTGASRNYGGPVETRKDSQKESTMVNSKSSWAS